MDCQVHTCNQKGCKTFVDPVTCFSNTWENLKHHTTIIQQILGIENYYRKFIPALATPLIDLKKKDVQKSPRQFCTTYPEDLIKYACTTKCSTALILVNCLHYKLYASDKVQVQHIANIQHNIKSTQWHTLISKKLRTLVSKHAT